MFGKIAGNSAAKYLEHVTGRRAMIGVETADSSDPDLIAELANKRMAAERETKQISANHSIAVTSFT